MCETHKYLEMSCLTRLETALRTLLLYFHPRLSLLLPIRRSCASHSGLLGRVFTSYSATSKFRMVNERHRRTIRGYFLFNALELRVNE